MLKLMQRHWRAARSGSILVLAVLGAIAVAGPSALAQSSPRPAPQQIFDPQAPTLTLPTVPPLPATPSGGGSPASAAPEIQGNRRDTLADCMADWDAGTHMSKMEWRAACERTVNGTDMPDLQYGYVSHTGRSGVGRHHR